MRAALVLFLANAMWAAEDAREPARKLLDEAAELAGAASLDVHVMALQRLGEAYWSFDRDKAAGWLRQAFAAAAALPEKERHGAQTRVVKSMATVNVEAAAELLRGMAEPGEPGEEDQSPAARVVELLLGKNEFDRALEVLNLIPERAVYPFAAAQSLFEKLAAGDSRRIILFGKATEAYRRNSSGEFPEFLARHWRNVPRTMAQAALEAVVNAVENAAEKTARVETLSAGEDTVELKSRQTVEFFRLAAVLRELEPKKLEDLLGAWPDLRAALKRFPDGRTSVNWTDRSDAVGSRDTGSFSHSSSSSSDDEAAPAVMSQIFAMCAPGRDIQKLHKEWSANSKQAAAAVGLAKENPRKALDAAKRIQLDALRAGTAAAIATVAAGKDEAAGNDAVNAALSILNELSVPEDRVAAHIGIAEAAHKLKNEKAAWESMEKAIADAMEIFRHDTSPDGVNKAAREYWPSVVAIRWTVTRAAKLFGARAAALLPGIADKDLALLGRIDMAGALLGSEITSMKVLVTH